MPKPDKHPKRPLGFLFLLHPKAPQPSNISPRHRSHQSDKEQKQAGCRDNLEFARSRAFSGFSENVEYAFRLDERRAHVLATLIVECGDVRRRDGNRRSAILEAVAMLIAVDAISIFPREWDKGTARADGLVGWL
ncbi:hypothetical protein BDZ91DRAFT_798366 [Kalaharituber pfeilii]|nr:hypothetical protein BDZ91DRAFT_798366 [Kalaharituber pfeilii]